MWDPFEFNWVTIDYPNVRVRSGKNHFSLIKQVSRFENRILGAHFAQTTASTFRLEMSWLQIISMACLNWFFSMDNSSDQNSSSRVPQGSAEPMFSCENVLSLHQIKFTLSKYVIESFTSYLWHLLHQSVILRYPHHLSPIPFSVMPCRCRESWHESGPFQAQPVCVCVCKRKDWSH